MSPDPNIGRLLANRYRLIELVGKGAMGRVYLARDMLLGGVPVAVKFLSHTLLNRKMRDRFEREATICALLGEKSIHIVRVRDYGIDDTEIPFYVMEFLKGDGLSELIKPKPLPLARFLTLGRQICLGLQCAHEGIFIENELCPIIHRDIKPSNILVIKDATLGELVKILDFGIAKLLQSDSSQTHSFMGTLAYCSPEQMEGKELDNRSDLYSLGVMMFEMLTSEMPLHAETHSFGGWYKSHHFLTPKTFDQVNPHLKLPKALENLVMSCLAKSPSDRPQSSKEVLRVLEQIEKSLSPARPIESPIQEIPPKPKPIITPPVEPILAVSLDDACRIAAWPKNKPIAEIVFPHIIRTSTEVGATVWVMLHKQEVINRQISTRYNQFLFLMSPHPMILWITALHNRAIGARWMPCYLDLKTPLGQELARNLGESGDYRILFFSIENPQRCANIMTSTIAPAQRKMLLDWANNSQSLFSASQPQTSKKLLKQEFEKLKPKILIKLESIRTASDISG